MALFIGPSYDPYLFIENLFFLTDDNRGKKYFCGGQILKGGTLYHKRFNF
jgi:hypothetical protein